MLSEDRSTGLAESACLPCADLCSPASGAASPPPRSFSQPSHEQAPPGPPRVQLRMPFDSAARHAQDWVCVGNVVLPGHTNTRGGSELDCFSPITLWHDISSTNKAKLSKVRSKAAGAKRRRSGAAGSAAAGAASLNSQPASTKTLSMVRFGGQLAGTGRIECGKLEAPVGNVLAPLMDAGLIQYDLRLVSKPRAYRLFESLAVHGAVYVHAAAFTLFHPAAHTWHELLKRRHTPEAAATGAGLTPAERTAASVTAGAIGRYADMFLPRSAQHLRHLAACLAQCPEPVDRLREALFRLLMLPQSPNDTLATLRDLEAQVVATTPAPGSPAPRAVPGSAAASGAAAAPGSPATPAPDAPAEDVGNLVAMYDSNELARALPLAQQPAGVAGLTLRPYQQQALAWMMSRERGPQPHDNDGGDASTAVPWHDADADQRRAAGLASSTEEEAETGEHPLWRRVGNDGAGYYYLNQLSREAALQAPPAAIPCRGGINSSEQGMGKSIEIAALVQARRAERGWIDGVPGAELAQDAPEPAPPGLRASRATLVVAPMSMLGQWQREFARVAPSAGPWQLRTLLHYGQRRAKSAAALAKYDVVITSYGTLATELAAMQGDAIGEAAGAGSSAGRAASARVLFGVQWDRVVCDEVHIIRNRSTAQARACCALEARHRWGLSGTPIQNGLDDLHALFAFLRHEPWCETAWWKRVIAGPNAAGDASAVQSLRDGLRPVLLRHTKAMRNPDGTPILTLPARAVHVDWVQLQGEDLQFYDDLQSKSVAEFQGYLHAGTAQQQYMLIFTLLLRLRQTCDHPLLAYGQDLPSQDDAAAFRGAEGVLQPISSSVARQVLRALAMKHAASPELAASIEHANARALAASGVLDSLPARAAAIVETLKTYGTATLSCPVCLEQPTHPSLALCCSTVLCGECLQRALLYFKGRKCPSCRQVVGTTDELKLCELAGSQADAAVSKRGSSSSASAIVSALQSKWRSSAKLDRLMQLLAAFAESNQSHIATMEADLQEAECDAQPAAAAEPAAPFRQARARARAAPASTQPRRAQRPPVLQEEDIVCLLSSDDDFESDSLPGTPATSPARTRETRRAAARQAACRIALYTNDESSSSNSCSSDGDSVEAAQSAQDERDASTGAAAESSIASTAAPMGSHGTCVDSESQGETGALEPGCSAAAVDEAAELPGTVLGWQPAHLTKVIVFSQWTSMLDVVELALKPAGIEWARLDGSMSQAAREGALSAFRASARVNVLLMSLKAGSLGLTVTEANVVILLDPWFNPAVEEQAVNRVHRLGQWRPVHIYRLIVQGSVEERMLALQAKKQSLASAALSGSSGPASGGAPTLEDFQQLFAGMM